MLCHLCMDGSFGLVAYEDDAYRLCLHHAYIRQCAAARPDVPTLSVAIDRGVAPDLARPTADPGLPVPALQTPSEPGRTWPELIAERLS